MKKNEFCFRPGSNRGPSACEADVMTTTPRKLIVIEAEKQERYSERERERRDVKEEREI